MPVEHDTQLCIASLNCWGLYTSPQRARRFGLIAKFLLESSFDVVALQEVWIRKDYERLVAVISSVFPYSYYFKSGVMGSGLVTFSRHPIRRAFFRRYTLNGHPHRICHGDWFSGKGVGGCRIELPDGRFLDFYNTHLHAEYDAHDDDYLPHRLCQFHECMQFIEMTTNEKHLCIAAGDFNTIPQSFIYKLFIEEGCLTATSSLVDSWHRYCKENDDSDLNGSTFNVAKSSFEKIGKPRERLDYIFYMDKQGLKLTNACLNVGSEVAGPAFSDHTMISAAFLLEPIRQPAGLSKVLTTDRQADMVKEAISIISKQIKRRQRSRRTCQALAGLGVLLFLAIIITVCATFFSWKGQGPTTSFFILFLLAPFVLIASFMLLATSGVIMQEEISALTLFQQEWQLWILSHADRS